MKFGSEAKTMATGSDLYSKPKNADFEHLDKILPLFQGLGDGNETYCGSLWHRA